jgi:hypothetical protein
MKISSSEAAASPAVFVAARFALFTSASPVKIQRRRHTSFQPAPQILMLPNIRISARRHAARQCRGAVSDVDQMLEIAETLLASVFPFKRSVRLLGVTLSSLNTEESGQEPQFAFDL